MKSVVIGVDGAGWNFLLNPALSTSNGAFVDLASRGLSGNLQSTTPPVTAPAWVSFATGCNPGEHGCYGFLAPRNGLSESVPVNSRNIARPTFYEMLEIVGKRCVLINLPCSFPPRIKGTVITSLMTVGDRFIFPKGVEDRVPGLKKYRPFPDMSLFGKGKIGPYLKDIREVERIRFECARELFEGEWDFFFVLFSGIDWALHATEGSLGQAAENADLQAICRDIGQYVCWFTDSAPRDACVLTVSDHGFSDYQKPFYINALLAQDGFLRLKETDSSFRRPHRLYEEYRSHGKSLPVPRQFVGLARRSPKLMWVLSKSLRAMPVQVSTRFHMVPSEDSAAACLSPGMSRFGTVYLNPQLPDHAGTLSKVRDSLLRAKDPHTGASFTKRVYLREEIYHGKAVHLGPDLIIEAQSTYWINNDLTFPTVTPRKGRTHCNHDLTGIYILTANGLKPQVKEASIMDAAPTVLSAYRIPIPGWMDGRPICGLSPG